MSGGLPEDRPVLPDSPIRNLRWFEYAEVRWTGMAGPPLRIGHTMHRAQGNAGVVAVARGIAIVSVAAGVSVCGMGQASATDPLPSGPFTMKAGKRVDCTGMGVEQGDATKEIKLVHLDCDTSDKGVQWIAVRLEGGQINLRNGLGKCISWSLDRYSEEELNDTEAHVTPPAKYEPNDCDQAAKFTAKPISEGVVVFLDTGKDNSENYLMRDIRNTIDRGPADYAHSESYQWNIVAV